MSGVGDLAWEWDVRHAAMAFVQDLAYRSVDGTVTRDQLQQFTHGGEQIKLLDTGRGIRNPRQLMATLTILTTLNSPYDDTVGPEGFVRYAIRDGELGEGDNRKLRRAYELQVPLIWFRGIRPGVFLPEMPVYLADEDPVLKQYVLSLGEDQRLMAPKMLAESAVDVGLEQVLAQRRYVERMTRQRLHQPAFRAGVMHAYGTRCSVCSLTHGALLDAAHIIPDGRPGGDPVTPNGLALCKIHHAAYDQQILGIGPDRVVRINSAVLQEVDGPMLRYGLQEFHGAPLRVIPSRRADQPDPERLAARFEDFLRAG